MDVCPKKSRSETLLTNGLRPLAYIPSVHVYIHWKIAASELCGDRDTCFGVRRTYSWTVSKHRQESEEHESEMCLSSHSTYLSLKSLSICNADNKLWISEGSNRRNSSPRLTWSFFSSSQSASRFWTCSSNSRIPGNACEEDRCMTRQSMHVDTTVMTKARKEKGSTVEYTTHGEAFRRRVSNGYEKTDCLRSQREGEFSYTQGDFGAYVHTDPSSQPPVW